MNQERFDDISKLIFNRLEDHDKNNTTCLLPLVDKHLDTEKCIPILEEVSKEFGVNPNELWYVLNELINTGQVLVVPNKSGRWGIIIYSKR